MNADDRQPLEEKAEQAKQRLFDNVDRLEERKGAVVKSARTVVIGAAVATALLGTVLFVAHRRKTRSQKTRWSLPARRRPTRSLGSRLARELFFSGGTIVATHLLRWGLSRYVPIEGTTTEVRWTET